MITLFFKLCIWMFKLCFYIMIGLITIPFKYGIYILEFMFYFIGIAFYVAYLLIIALINCVIWLINKKRERDNAKITAFQENKYSLGTSCTISKVTGNVISSDKSYDEIANLTYKPLIGYIHTSSYNDAFKTVWVSPHQRVRNGRKENVRGYYRRSSWR